MFNCYVPGTVFFAFSSLQGGGQLDFKGSKYPLPPLNETLLVFFFLLPLFYSSGKCAYCQISQECSHA